MPDVKSVLTSFFQSKLFKRTTFIIGIIFIIATIFITINPAPFLRFGYLGVFIFNLFGGSGVFLIPALAKYMSIVGLSFATALGMGGNDSVAYLIGSSGTTVIPKNKKLQKIENSVQKYGMYALFFWSFIPFPYDLVGFVAGYLGLSYPRYIIPTFLGKFIRSVLIGYGILRLLQ